MKLIASDFSDVNSIRKISDSEAKEYEQAYIFDLEWEAELREVIQKRQELKKQFDDSMALVYQLRNKITLSKIAK